MDVFEKAFLRKRSSLKKTTLSIFSFLFFRKKRNEDGGNFLILAETSYLHGDNNEALRMIEASIRNGGGYNWRNFAFKANVLEDLQKYSQAIMDYEKAIELSETDEKVYALYHQIGICYLCLGENEKARDFYTYAIVLKNRLKSKNVKDLEEMNRGVMIGLPFKRLYNNRGNALKNLGKLNEAIDDCQKALSYDNQYSNTYLLLSQIYSQSGQENKAIEMLEKSARLGNQNAIKMQLECSPKLDNMIQSRANQYMKLAQEAYQQENLGIAKKYFVNIIELDTSEKKLHFGVTPYLGLTLIYAILEEWNNCELITKKGLEIEPNNTTLLNHMGVAICSQSNNRILNGLYYFKKGFELGDKTNCGGNYLFWCKQIE